MKKRKRMKKSRKVMLIFLSTIAMASCGKSGKQINNQTGQEQDWTVQSSTNNQDSVTYYHRRSGGFWYLYPFIWHNMSRQHFGTSGRYAPSYFSRKGGFTVGNHSVTRGGFGSTSKGGSS
jgi:hypothetical protein